MDQRGSIRPRAMPAAPARSREDTPDKASNRRLIDSASLFEGARELFITHRGESYCLRVTRNGKLILTK